MDDAITSQLICKSSKKFLEKNHMTFKLINILSFCVRALVNDEVNLKCLYAHNLLYKKMRLSLKGLLGKSKQTRR